jgi:hypothetical protein
VNGESLHSSVTKRQREAHEAKIRAEIARLQRWCLEHEVPWWPVSSGRQS